VNQPEIGDPLEPLGRGHILAANRLMFLATAIATAVFLAVRWGVAAIMEGV
jgi:hypothetical protein